MAKKTWLWPAIAALMALGSAAFGQAALKGATIAPHPLAEYTPVTDAVLRAPDPSDWIMMRGNYQGWGFSTLDQINKTNVKGLQLAWARTMEPGINEAAPIVYKGVMFLGNPGDVVQAIDARTGDLLWQYRRTLPSMTALHNNYWGQRKRSVFLYDDKVYTLTWDNFLVALDARTGKEVWETDRGGDLQATNTNGPIVVNGVVIAGANCQEAPFGCYVTGHDARTGKELWRNTVIPKKGEKGDETWGGMPFEQRWMTGVWGPITYDPELDMAFYGSSGVGPSADVQRGVHGVATLAGTNTRYAIEPRTGRIIWQHQVLPQDNWDQECTFEMIPITTKVAPDVKEKGMMAIGRRAASASRKTLTGVPCKTSILWSFDAAKGDFLWAKSTVFQNLVNGIDAKGKVTVNPDQLMTDLHKTYHQCPTHSGGRDWPFSAYSPQTNMLYVQLQNLCTDYAVRADNIPSKPKDQYNTSGKPMIADGSVNIGRLDAISVETGKTLWSWETPASNYSPVLATAGGILFNGGMDRYFRAFDQQGGKVLWQTRLGSQVFGTPVTFRIDGRQYVAVAAGGGYNTVSPTLRPDIDQVSGGNMVYVFALPQ
ncbi:MAG: ATP-binding protein [Alphaproteobacteria bacterium]|nr:ATP-binding protein [Alphaproteobacteria bacterium]